MEYYAVGECGTEKSISPPTAITVGVSTSGIIPPLLAIITLHCRIESAEGLLGYVEGSKHLSGTK
jgi:hypothetical protein